MGVDMGHVLVEEIEQKQRVGEAGWIWQGVWPPSLAWEEGTHTHATAPIFTVPKSQAPGSAPLWNTDLCLGLQTACLNIFSFTST